MIEKLVSVIVPLYNREDYIKEAIDSLLAQLYDNIEVIVIDDCSTDRGVSIVEAYEDEKIKIIRNDKNMGISYTRSRGFEEARGEYIAILDSDDIALPERIAKQVAYLDDNPKVGVVGSNRIEFCDGRDIRRSKHELIDNELKVAFLFDMPMTNPSLMMRREVIEEFTYDDEYVVAEDYEFLYRVSKKWKIGNIEEPLIKYRLHDGQITKNHDESSYLKNIKTRVFDELKIKLDKNMVDIYYRGINLKISSEEVEEFTKVILKIISRNEELSIYNKDILRKKLLGKLERVIKRNLKGIRGLRHQKNVLEILKSEGIILKPQGLRILANVFKKN